MSCLIPPGPDFSLTAEEQKAVDRFAARIGPCWRQKLSTVWITGDDVRQPEGRVLRDLLHKVGHDHIGLLEPRAI